LTGTCKIRKVKLRTFQGGSASTAVCKVHAGRRSHEDSYNSAMSRIGEQWAYNALNYNCMHFAFQCRANVTTRTATQVPSTLANIASNLFAEW
jgi:hypothetical protein